MPEDGIECKCFMIISIDSLTDFESKYCFQAYLDESIDRIVDKQIIYYLDNNVIHFGDKN